MDWPRTLAEAGTWLVVQFPVFGAALLAARWTIRETGRFYDKLADHLREVHERHLREKSARRTDLMTVKDAQLAEKDRRIEQLEAEVRALERKVERLRKSEGER